METDVRTKKRLSFFAPALFLLFLILPCSCASLEKAASKTCPLVVFEEKITEKDCIGLEFSFINFSGREIKGVLFFAEIGPLEAEDGALEDGDFYEKDFEFAALLEHGKEERVFIPFDEVESGFGAEDFSVRHLAVQSVVFSDGSVWKAH